MSFHRGFHCSSFRWAVAANHVSAGGLFRFAGSPARPTGFLWQDTRQLPDTYRVGKNISVGERFEVTLSWQSVPLLNELAKRGVFGRSAAEVGGRFIEQALQVYVDSPKFSLDLLVQDDQQK